MTSKRWYVEKWDAAGTRAKSHCELDDFGAVKKVLLEARNAGTGEILRIRAPLDACSSHLAEMESLGRPRL